MRKTLKMVGHAISSLNLKEMRTESEDANASTWLVISRHALFAKVRYGPILLIENFMAGSMGNVKNAPREHLFSFDHVTRQGCYLRLLKLITKKRSTIVAKRRDTRLESEGAEFLVVGQLLIRGIEAYKTYTRMPGYDLIAANSVADKVARIQVKSRYGSRQKDFPIKNFDSDFVIYVKLNRGYKKPLANGDTGIRDPEFFILPTKLVEKVIAPDDPWSKFYARNLDDFDSYKDRWDLIIDYLDANA